jgi:hypothetical protein
MRPLEESKQLLARLYGFEFPDSLFLVHKFFDGLDAPERDKCYSALGMWPIGLLDVLSLPEAESKNLQPPLPLVLHGRFYRDVPEFFSCWQGDQDQLHWGLLFDEPAKGFRGVASYYHLDTSPITVYPSLFSAILKRLECRLDTSEPVEAGEKADYHARQELLRSLSDKLRSFIEQEHIAMDDGRGTGLPSDTGLDLLVADKGEDWFSTILDWFSRWPRSDWSVFPPVDHPHAVHLGKMKETSEIQQLVRKAISAGEKGRALPALSLGRSLWFYGQRSWLVNSADYAAEAYDLLKRAYTLLNRPALLQILDIHFEHRALASVDLLPEYRNQGRA